MPIAIKPQQQQTTKHIRTNSHKGNTKLQETTTTNKQLNDNRN